MKRPLIITTIISFLGMACSQPDNYNELLNDLYKNTVPTIQSSELAAKLKSDKITVLDTREIEEYNVSHISNSKHVGYNNFHLKNLSELDKSDTIVLYCSVGYRSERIGEKLLKAGYTHVYNLYGGLFQWVNEGQEVVGNDNQPTDKIHPYSDSWGKWLTKGKKVYKP